MGDAEDEAEFFARFEEKKEEGYGIGAARDGDGEAFAGAAGDCAG